MPNRHLTKLKEQNRKRISALVHANPDGIRAAAISKRTRLCLRTVQTHLRALRDEASIVNHRGLWQPLD